MNIVLSALAHLVVVRGSAVARHGEELMDNMWTGVEVALSSVEEVLVGMVGITREIGSVMDASCGKQKL